MGKTAFIGYMTSDGTESYCTETDAEFEFPLFDTNGDEIITYDEWMANAPCLHCSWLYQYGPTPYNLLHPWESWTPEPVDTTDPPVNTDVSGDVSPTDQESLAKEQN